MISNTLISHDSEIEPAPISAGGRRPEPELDTLSQIADRSMSALATFPRKTAEETQKVITEEIAPRVEANQRYRNARQNSDKGNSRIAMDSALGKVMTGIMSNQTELFKTYQDDPGFKSALAELIFRLTYQAGAKSSR